MNDTYVALLRGLNVGGKNKLPMVALANIFTEAGCEDVRTYIQSGNVIFKASPAVAKRLAAAVAKSIETDHGFKSPVVLRTAKEIHAAARNNPFSSPEAIHVAFLADLPSPAAVKGLDLQRSPPDVFKVRGREVYLHLPNGVAHTKLTNDYFDRTLSTVSTLRNWNTLTKLIELATADQK